MSNAVVSTLRLSPHLQVSKHEPTTNMDANMDRTLTWHPFAPLYNEVPKGGAWAAVGSTNAGVTQKLQKIEFDPPSLRPEMPGPQGIQRFPKVR